MSSLARQTTCRLLSKHYVVNKSALVNPCRNKSMYAWKVHDSLDNPNEATIRSKLSYMETKLPTISSPSDVLVKVHSTSINPLDIRMVYGYGRRVLDLLDIATNFEPKITYDRYPLTLGRDFSGEIIATGPCSSKSYQPGDLVYGAIDPQRSGSHAQYISVPSYCLTKKPNNLNHNEAASIPFVALTAYSALCTFGQLSKNNCSSKQVLVLGGSGGVGSFAIQLLKLWGANVVATCSEEKIEWLENSLFVDQALCYNDLSQMDTLTGRFDFILDCASYDSTSFTRQDIIKNSLKYLKPMSQSIYVTLSPPILSNTDKHGIVLGGAQTAIEAICDTVVGLSNFNSARWAVFLPNKWALNYISSLYADETITPQISSIFNFTQIPEAYEKLQSGKVRGKIVVDLMNLDSTSENKQNNTIADDKT